MGLLSIEPPEEGIGDRVLEAIRDAIASQALPPGASLSEASLAAQLGVSKTPVREALIRLSEIGMVERVRARLRVIQPSRSVVSDAYELRCGLESFAAYLAAQRADARTVALIEEAAASGLGCMRVSDSSGRPSWRNTFHGLVASASRNSALSKQIEDCFTLTWTLRTRDAPKVIDDGALAQHHLDVARKIREGDPAGARDSMAQHLQSLQKSIVDSYGETRSS